MLKSIFSFLSNKKGWTVVQPYFSLNSIQLLSSDFACLDVDDKTIIGCINFDLNED